MTTTKLITIALGLASLVAGALLVTGNPVAGGTLLAAGGKLVGLALPEIGKKPAAPEADADDTNPIGPALLLLLVALALPNQACTPGAVNWPKVLQCAAPLEQPLLVSVANVLAGSGDVEDELAKLTTAYAPSLIECAVQQLVTDLGSSPVTARASRQVTRGRAFLAKVQQ